MKHAKNTLRNWLIENGYEDVDQLIGEIILEWKQTGNKQRRNWMEILAGDLSGQPRTIAGRRIPILKAAQVRQGLNITDSAICRSENEPIMPQVHSNNRWKKKI